MDAEVRISLEYTASGPYLLLVQASQNGEEKRTGSMEPYAMEDVCEAAGIEGWHRRCDDRTEGGTGKGEKK
jgi:hypothetical protein